MNFEEPLPRIGSLWRTAAVRMKQVCRLTLTCLQQIDTTKNQRDGHQVNGLERLVDKNMAHHQRNRRRDLGNPGSTQRPQALNDEIVENVGETSPEQSEPENKSRQRTRVMVDRCNTVKVGNGQQ